MINSGVSSTKDNSVNVQKKKFFFNNEQPSQNQNQNNNFKSINNIIKPEKINININNNININHDNNNYNKNNDFNNYNKNNDFNNNNNFKNFNNNNDYNNSNHSKKNKNNNKILNNNETNQKKKITYPDGSSYEGYLKNNEYDGYGEYRSKSYNYFGEFSSGKKHGEGRLEDLVKNIEYKGSFVNNMKEGYGEERYRDGSIYKGQFKDNMKHGKGIFCSKEKETMDTKVILKKIKYQAKENLNGIVKKNIQASGKIMKLVDMGYYWKTK